MLTLKWLYNFPTGATKNDILAMHKLSSSYTLDHLIYFLENPDKISGGKQFRGEYSAIAARKNT